MGAGRRWGGAGPSSPGRPGRHGRGLGEFGVVFLLVRGLLGAWGGQSWPAAHWLCSVVYGASEVPLLPGRPVLAVRGCLVVEVAAERAFPSGSLAPPAVWGPLGGVLPPFGPLPCGPVLQGFSFVFEGSSSPSCPVPSCSVSRPLLGVSWLPFGFRPAERFCSGCVAGCVVRPAWAPSPLPRGVACLEQVSSLSPSL